MLPLLLDDDDNGGDERDNGGGNCCCCFCCLGRRLPLLAILLSFVDDKLIPRRAAKSRARRNDASFSSSFSFSSKMS